MGAWVAISLRGKKITVFVWTKYEYTKLFSKH